MRSITVSALAELGEKPDLVAWRVGQYVVMDNVAPESGLAFPVAYGANVETALRAAKRESGKRSTLSDRLIGEVCLVVA
jgi:hypothetical protein